VTSSQFTLEVISQAAFSHQLNLLSDAGNRLSQVGSPLDRFY
jgi:hypothetical protein